MAAGTGSLRLNFPSRLKLCLIISRHHAEKARASGFCYVADCVLAILSLKRTVPSLSPTQKSRVMYLDLDLHFSDAVSQAFYKPGSATTSQVLVRAPQAIINHRLMKLFFSDAIYSSRSPRLFPCFTSCLSSEYRRSSLRSFHLVSTTQSWCICRDIYPHLAHHRACQCRFSA